MSERSHDKIHEGHIPFPGGEREVPTADAIKAAIASAEQGTWFDPTFKPLYWHCTLFDSDNRRCGTGSGYTSEKAMAMAWLCAMAPDALIDSYVDRDEVPLEIPPGYHFEVMLDGVIVEALTELCPATADTREVADDIMLFLTCGRAANAGDWTWATLVTDRVRDAIKAEELDR